MTRQSVKSSNINSVGYDPAKQLLEVEFQNGGLFHYHKVSPQAHAALLKAKSIGSHFHSKIRARHKATAAP